MNKTSLWIVLIVTAIWIGFLSGYAVASHHGGVKPAAQAAPAVENAGAGGYGKPATEGAPAAENAGAGGYGKPATQGAPAVEKAAAGAYGK